MNQTTKLVWWDRFTEQTQRAVLFAEEEAARVGENYVSTEHLLLGLLREDNTVAADVLDRIEVGRSILLTEIERHVAWGQVRREPDRNVHLTPRAQHILDLALDEARRMNQSHIGTGHLLLGLVREGEGLAGRVLNKLGVDLVQARREVQSRQDRETADGPSPDNEAGTE